MWTIALGSLTLYQVLSFFLLYSVTGWCIEVIYCSVDTGKFVNRGFLNGPLCPIYGVGGILAIYLLLPLADNIFILYIASVIVASLVELIAGFVLKKLFHTSWWNYSDQPFNLGGYICLKFSLLWGIACVVMVKIIHPAFSAFLEWLPMLLGEIVLVVCYVLMLCDLIVTVAAIAKLNHNLGEISKLAENLHRGSDVLAKGIGNTALSVAGKLEELDLPAQKGRVAAKMKDGRNKVSHALQEGYEKVGDAFEEGRDKLGLAFDAVACKLRLDELKKKADPIQKRLLKAFPGMKHEKYPDALNDVRSSCEKKGSASTGDSAEDGCKPDNGQ